MWLISHKLLIFQQNISAYVLIPSNQQKTKTVKSKARAKISKMKCNSCLLVSKRIILQAFSKSFYNSDNLWFSQSHRICMRKGKQPTNNYLYKSCCNLSVFQQNCKYEKVTRKKFLKIEDFRKEAINDQ